MKFCFKRFYNGKASSIPAGAIYLITSAYSVIVRKIASFLQLSRIGSQGTGCSIGRHVTISYPANLYIADRVVIADNVLLFSEFSDSQIHIGSNSSISNGCILDFSGELEIGNNCTLSGNVIVETHTHGYDPNTPPKKRKKKIGNNVWIGRNALILPQVQEIDNGAIIGAGAVVTKNVPAYTVIAGNPARAIKKRPPSEFD